jgi:hypothetical protein
MKIQVVSEEDDFPAVLCVALDILRIVPH